MIVIEYLLSFMILGKDEKKIYLKYKKKFDSAYFTQKFFPIFESHMKIFSFKFPTAAYQRYIYSIRRLRRTMNVGEKDKT